ncbi:hypothetical protein LINGRAHAP2_LOCUS27944 [Linum grandiflorum]
MIKHTRSDVCSPPLSLRFLSSSSPIKSHRNERRSQIRHKALHRL